MTLSFDQIKHIIETNPNKSVIAKAVEEHNLLNMHVNGVGVKEHLSSLKNYESKLQLEVGQNIIESNKGLYNSLLHPINKVFSAKGGTRQYSLPKYSVAEFKSKLNNVAHGLSLRKWIEKKIYNKYITDPNGLIFLEVADNEVTPTFKSITTVYDYETTGQQVKYIVFKPQKIDDSDKLYYRVVDDSFDYYIEVGKTDNGNTYLIREDLTFPVHFSTCPAYVVSDLFDDVYNIKTSFVAPTLDKANTFLYDNAISAKHKLLHGFPKYWEYGRSCIPCSGSGIVENKDGEEEKCGVCNGSGFRPFGDVSDKLVLELPSEKESPILTKFSGHDSPDIEILKQYKEDLKDHEQSLFRTLWNISYIGEQKQKTATQSALEVQPINDKLPTVSDCFENIEQFITDMMGEFYYETAYQGASINYGRRYLTESPDAILEKLTKAKQNKMPIAFLMNLSKEYVQSLYANNEIESSIQLKLLEIEPFPFLTIDEVLRLGISNEDKKRKIYFQEWYQSKNETELLLKNKQSLKADLQLFINDKTLEDETQPLQRVG